MRLALISDTHGNEVALKAVLDGIQRTGADQIVCPGDVATLGPKPGAILEMLGQLGKAPTLLHHAEYSVVESKTSSININLRRVALDMHALRQAVAASDNPLRGMLLQQYSA